MQFSCWYAHRRRRRWGFPVSVANRRTLISIDFIASLLILAIVFLAKGLPPSKTFSTVPYPPARCFVRESITNGTESLGFRILNSQFSKATAKNDDWACKKWRAKFSEHFKLSIKSFSFRGRSSSLKSNLTNSTIIEFSIFFDDFMISNVFSRYLII